MDSSFRDWIQISVQPVQPSEQPASARPPSRMGNACGGSPATSAGPSATAPSTHHAGAGAGPGASDADALAASLEQLAVSPHAAGSRSATADEGSSSDASSDDLPEPGGGVPGDRAGPKHVRHPAAPLPADSRVGLLYDQSMEHHLGPDHYERPARIIQVYQTLQEEGLLDRCWHLVPRKATDAELLLGHSREHINKVDGMFGTLFPVRPPELKDALYCYADGKMRDVYVCGGTAEAARCATGCCVEASEAVLRGTVRRALAVVRPPGHHAECERAMGFCFFNNVAIAALVALQTQGVARVAVLDWDIHHGNGIQELLQCLPGALYISLHRDPSKFYPYTTGYVGEVGVGPGKGFNVNIPWKTKGVGDGDYMAAFSLIIEPILESYQPDLVIVAAGFDAADGDPLGGCKVSPEGYGWMTERLLRFAGGKVVLALEGGYNTRVTAWCAAACVRTMLEGVAPPLTRDMTHLWPSEAYNSLKAVYEVQRDHWKALAGRPFQQAWDEHLAAINVMLGPAARSRRGGGGMASSSGNSFSGQEGQGGWADSGRHAPSGGTVVTVPGDGAANSDASSAAPASSLAAMFAARKAARSAKAEAPPATASTSSQPEDAQPAAYRRSSGGVPQRAPGRQAFGSSSSPAHPADSYGAASAVAATRITPASEPVTMITVSRRCSTGSPGRLQVSGASGSGGGGGSVGRSSDGTRPASAGAGPGPGSPTLTALGAAQGRSSNGGGSFTAVAPLVVNAAVGCGGSSRPTSSAADRNGSRRPSSTGSAVPPLADDAAEDGAEGEGRGASFPLHHQ